MEIIMTAGTGSLAPARYGWQPVRTRSLRTRFMGTRLPRTQLMGTQLLGSQRHLVEFHNPVAPIGTDVPVADRMRVSAPEP